MSGKSVPILDPILLNTGSEGVSAVGRCKDYGGNSFVARLIQQGNNTWTELYKHNQAGALVDFTDFTMADGPNAAPRKMIDVCIIVDGDDIVATVTGYNLTAPQRLHYQEEFVWQGKAVPFPQGVQPDKGAGPEMFRSEGSPDPGGEPGMTLEELTEALQDQNSDLAVAVGKIVKNKSRDAIGTEGVMTERMFSGGSGSAVVYQQLINTSYTGALGAIRDSGHKPEQPTATEAPKP